MRLIVAAIAATVVSFSALAADLPLPAPAPAPAAYIPPPPPFSWIGFYIGGNLGGGWSRGNVTDTVFGVNFTNGNSASFLGGGQFGGNYQVGNFVIGAEVDFDWFANNNNSGNGTTVPGGAILRVSANDRWVTTLAARFGWAALDHLLLYGKAGGGWVGASNFAVTNVGTGTSAAISNSNTNSGWLVGAGIEWAFTQSVTAKVEYDFLGLTNASYTVVVPGVGTDTFSTGNRNVQMLTVGVNYLFNWQ
jgi:outer membrane immunogenic protein